MVGLGRLLMFSLVTHCSVFLRAEFSSAFASDHMVDVLCDVLSREVRKVTEETPREREGRSRFLLLKETLRTVAGLCGSSGSRALDQWGVGDDKVVR